jgi:hypothetical protein
MDLVTVIAFDKVKHFTEWILTRTATWAILGIVVTTIGIILMFAKKKKTKREEQKENKRHHVLDRELRLLGRVEGSDFWRTQSRLRRHIKNTTSPPPPQVTTNGVDV